MTVSRGFTSIVKRSRKFKENFRAWRKRGKAAPLPRTTGKLQKCWFPPSRTQLKRSDNSQCRPECGENRALCRARKLARQRRILEDNVRAFSQCIRDAQMHGDSLDQIRCYYR